MNTPTTLNNLYDIRGTDIYSDYLLNYASLIHYFQNNFACICANAELAAYDIHPQNKSWVISDFYMEFSVFRPRWRQTVNVQSWVQPIHGIRTTNHCIISHEKQIVAKGIGLWLVINELTRRPVFLDDVAQKFPIYDHNCLPQFSFSPIPITHNESTIPYTFKVEYADIDFNHHFNSVHYFVKALESIKEELLLGRLLRSVEMKFLKEAHLGDTIEVHFKKENHLYYHSLFHRQEEVFRMRTCWE